MLEGGAEIVDAGVAARAERAGVVGDSFAVHVDQDWRSGEFVEGVRDDYLLFWGENEMYALLQQGVNRTKRETIGSLDTSKGKGGRHSVIGHGYVGERGDYVSIRTNAGRGDGMS